MFSALRRGAWIAALGVSAALPVVAASDEGEFAAAQARKIATDFPGRMTGTPTEQHAADYLRQQFTQMGYQTNVRKLDIRYRYRKADKRNDWHLVDGYMTIAGKKTPSPYQIIIMAHVDTFAPLNVSDTEKQLGGPDYQGIDDNASGVGVMLELAQRLSTLPLKHTVRFLAPTGEEEGRFGSIHYVDNMHQVDWRNTLLVINLDNLFIGDNLYFNSGVNTNADVAALTRDRALALAAKLKIAATTNPGLHKTFPAGTGCCSDADSFDKYGIPVLSVEATNWSLGKFNGYQQVEKSVAFPDGIAWHNPQLDNVKHLDRVLPGRISSRSRDVVKILMPLLTEWLTSDLLPPASTDAARQREKEAAAAGTPTERPEQTATPSGNQSANDTTAPDDAPARPASAPTRQSAESDVKRR